MVKLDERAQTDKNYKEAAFVTIVTLGLVSPVSLPFMFWQKSKLKKLDEAAARNVAVTAPVASRT